MSEWRARLAGVTDDDRRLATIRGLLAKAEATEFPDEAEAFFAKASELIGRWAIDEALLWAAADEASRERPDELRLVLHSPYLPQKAVLVGVVAAAHGCRAVRLVSPPGTGTEVVSVVGFPAELVWVDTLVTSLMVQLTSAMLARRPVGLTPSASASWRRSFIIGFAEEVGRRLEDDRAAATAAADRGSGRNRGRNRGRESGSSSSAGSGGDGPGASTELVLASRQEDVDTELRRRHPHLRSSYASSGRSADGRRHGRVAGSQASIGRPDIGGRRALGS